MRLALAEADQAHDDGDVPVGAVVLGPAGAVLGRGRNAREAGDDPTAHAEVVALRAAGAALGRWRLDGCTLVVTLEPCTMCAGAAVLARLDRLVFGAYDPKAARPGRCGTWSGTVGSTTAPRSSAGCSRTSAPSGCARGSRRGADLG